MKKVTLMLMGIAVMSSGWVIASDHIEWLRAHGVKVDPFTLLSNLDSKDRFHCFFRLHRHGEDSLSYTDFRIFKTDQLDRYTERKFKTALQENRLVHDFRKNKSNSKKYLMENDDLISSKNKETSPFAYIDGDHTITQACNLIKERFGTPDDFRLIETKKWTVE